MMSDKNGKDGELQKDRKKNVGDQSKLSQSQAAIKGKTSSQNFPRSKPARQKKLNGSERRAARRRRQIISYGIPSVILLIIIAFVFFGSAKVNGPARNVDFTQREFGSVKVNGPARNAAFVQGERVPSFSAPGLNSGIVSWEKGKPTVLAIWAAWCDNCQREIPKLNKIKDGYPKVNIVSIVTGQGQEPGPKPETFVADNNITIPIAVDDAGMTLARAMGVRSLPTLYLINADGTVFRKLEISMSDADLRAGFEHLSAQAGAIYAGPRELRSKEAR